MVRPPACASPPPSRIAVAEIERQRHLGAGLVADQRGQPLRQLALVRLGEGFDQHLGDDQRQHPVAEELEPLVAGRGAELAALAWVSAVIEQLAVGEAVAEARLERLCRGAAALPHTTVVNIRSQRTVHGHFQNSQAALPSSTEKKMTSARPTRFSNGT